MDMASTTAGPPNAKEKKYDRQLRLWGQNGQQALEASHICLVNASATGCEVLKNLILPGIGRFTIVDDATVSEADLGVNFFLDDTCVGKSRAECTYHYLSELNPDVQGAYINDSISSLMTSDPTFISTHSISALLLCAPLPTKIIHELQRTYLSLAIFHVYCVGFTASLRISLPELCIAETHPDSLTDLRLLNPWPELLSFAEEATRDMASMNEHQHGHIPYLALLLHFLDIWKQGHQGSSPQTYKEKNEFKKLIIAGMKTDAVGGSEENFEEAVAAVLANVKVHEISSGTREVLEDERCKILEQDAEGFWIIARAVAEFVDSPTQGSGLLPLSGSVPDMKAESHEYVKLQNLYRKKAVNDMYMVSQNVSRILTSLGRPTSDVPEEEIGIWCRHANFVKRIRYRALIEEWEIDEFHAKAISSALVNEPNSPIPIYIALRAYQAFFDSYLRSPGGEPSVDDVPELVGHAKLYIEKVEAILNREDNPLVNSETWDAVENWCKEICRYGGAELHNIASLAGGLVSQEVIKCMTRQYLPVSNTVVVDGVASKCGVWEL